MKIVVTVPFDNEQKNRLEAAYPAAQYLFTDAASLSAKELSSADALIGNVPVNMLKGMDNLKWIQLNSSGADAYAIPGAVSENAVLTCATGAYGHAISEYMVGMLLAMMKKIPFYLQCQKEGRWMDGGMVDSPANMRVLLVGCGNIGLEFAKRIKPFGCKLVGIRRQKDICPSELDEVYGPESLKQQVAIADVVAISLPGTKSCYHMFDRQMLLECKKNSYLLNVGRGSVIDNAALLDEEVSSHFAGIWLDVCEKEPLEDDDPLFFVPNMLITPHITGGYHLSYTLDNILDISIHNLKVFAGLGGEYKSVVNKKEGYATH